MKSTLFANRRPENALAVELEATEEDLSAEGPTCNEAGGGPGGRGGKDTPCREMDQQACRLLARPYGFYKGTLSDPLSLVLGHD